MSEPAIDRRRHRRQAHVEHHGVDAARIRPGRDVAIVDISEGGALIEGGHRLVPGGSLELQLQQGQRSASVRGRVVRSYVAQLRSDAINYRVAVMFERNLHWFSQGAPEVNGRSTPASP